MSKESLRTIIKVVVNTIELEKVKEAENRNLIFGLYQYLEKTFNLQLGKILLGVSSPSELREMLMRKLPYITPFSNEMELCFVNNNCKSLENLINLQGK